MMVRKIGQVFRSTVKMVARDALLNVLAGSALLPTFVRVVIYRAAGLNIRTHKIYPQCFFGGTQVSIGRGTFVSYRCFFDASAAISIGDNCAIANESCFVTSFHDIGGPAARAGERRMLPISVGDGCWIGARVTVLPGVSIGDGCIIAAGAVVTRNCEPNGLYAGVPARLIRQLESGDASSAISQNGAGGRG
jgi:maltose O-acetyltransferase